MVCLLLAICRHLDSDLTACEKTIYDLQAVSLLFLLFELLVIPTINTCSATTNESDFDMTEVLIIGGGVFGLATAYSLATGRYSSCPSKILVIGVPSFFFILPPPRSCVVRR